MPRACLVARRPRAPLRFFNIIFAGRALMQVKNTQKDRSLTLPGRSAIHERMHGASVRESRRAFFGAAGVAIHLRLTARSNTTFC
jgi:hypothetical protein